MKLLLVTEGSRAVLKGLGKRLSRTTFEKMLSQQWTDETDPGSDSFGPLVKDGGQAFIRLWHGTCLRIEKLLLSNGSSQQARSRYESTIPLAQQLLPADAIKPGLPLFVEDDPLIIGHTMPYIDSLRSFEELAPSWSAPQAVKALECLHGYIERLHSNNVLLGEVNWSNVGFDRDGNFVAFDTLNYDFPNFPCETACRATIDPTLLIQDDGILDSDPRAWERERPYSARSDWFGFRCIVTKVLTGFWPWDGTDYRAHSSHELRRPRVRALRSLSIFDPKVRLASQGLVCPPERLAESLYDDLYKAFNERRRRSFPLRLLTESDWVRCSVCGFDFSSSRCPCGG